MTPTQRKIAVFGGVGAAAYGLRYVDRPEPRIMTDGTGKPWTTWAVDADNGPLKTAIGIISARTSEPDRIVVTEAYVVGTSKHSKGEAAGLMVDRAGMADDAAFELQVEMVRAAHWAFNKKIIQGLRFYKKVRAIHIHLGGPQRYQETDATSFVAGSQSDEMGP